jgi:hypothetical protein
MYLGRPQPRFKKLYYMKKNFTLLFSLITSVCAFSQNVGIGTTTPQTNLHVAGTGTSVIVRIETGTVSQEAGLELKSGAAAFDFLELRKWPTGSAGTIAGINLDGLSTISTGSNSSAGLLIGTKTNYPIYFTTGNLQRMLLSATGELGIGTDPSIYNKLTVVNDAGDGISGRSNFIPAPGQYISAVKGVVSNTAVRGAGVTGYTVNAGEFSTGILPGMYGVLGTAIEQGYGVGAFGATGAGGIYSSVLNGSGKALKTVGAIQLQGIGEGVGKVLSSDGAGNATWELAGGTHTHYGQSWSGSALKGLEVINLFSTDFNVALSGITSNTTAFRSKGVLGSSGSTTGIGVYGINTTGTTFFSPEDNSGVSGVAGTGTGVFGAGYSGIGVWGISNSAEGVYGNSGTGNSIYGFKNGASGGAGFFNLTNASNTSPSLKAQAVGGTVLELSNGFVKVSGANRTAFTITATASNSSAHILNLNYVNQLQTDILIVTHNYNPPAATPGYHNYNVGVYWDGNNWTIYNENTTIPILGVSFNVLVIKQ